MRYGFRFISCTGTLFLVCYILNSVRCTKCQEAFLENQSWRYAREGEFPWMVSLQHADVPALGHFCGGIIAAPNLVLTACHCLVIHSAFNVDEKPYVTEASSKVVVAGSLNNNRSDPNHFRVVVGISRFIIHPKCRHFHVTVDGSVDDRGGWDSDFGLAVLKKNLTLDGKNLAVFRLLAWNDLVLKRDLERRMSRHIECVVTGWGKRLVRNANGSLSYYEKSDNNYFWPQLTVIQVKLDDFASCYNIMCKFDKRYCEVDHWGRSQLCATSQGEMEVCQGDSGGPLMCGSSYFLYGLVGWGPSCGKYKVPSVYPTIYDGLDFIMHHLGRKLKTRSQLTIISTGDTFRTIPPLYFFAFYLLAMRI